MSVGVNGRSRRRGTLELAAALALCLALPGTSAADPGSWFSENVEFHGFISSKGYFRSPNFNEDVELNSWRNELNLEFSARLFRSSDLRIGLFGVVRPIYDAVYEINDDVFGEHASLADIGTSPAYPDDVLGIARKSGRGESFPGHGAQLEGEFTLVNSDTGTFFTGEKAPAVSIDNVVFYGRVTAPVMPWGRRQAKIGGNANGVTYQDLRDHFVVPNGGLPFGLGLDGSLGLSGTDPSPGNIGFGSTNNTPLNFYAGSLGDRGSLEHGSVDINRRETQLKFDTGDNAHPYGPLRELYLEFEFGKTFIRLGKQQIVWGKTDAFRLQDKINPIDLGYHNVFPELEERRIPQLALDAIYSFGNVGPLQDVSLEFAWVFDRFVPDQFGQCGEPWAFTASCEARADAGGHQLLNLSLAAVDEVSWKLENTEPGLRLEFRIPEPSIAFSISGFWTRQDTPVARFKNLYSVDNPNPAGLLFLQGLYNAGAGAPLANVIESLAGIVNPSRVPGTTVWTTGFDAYARGADGRPLGTLAEANTILLEAWRGLFAIPPAFGGCGGLTGQALAECGGSVAVFGLPWSMSEGVLEYPRIFSLGASLDYQIPGIDTVLRVEMATDFDRHFNNTDKRDGVDSSDVFQVAVGLDRSTFIPFINRNRTSFLSFQTFVEHIIDYEEGEHVNTGPVPYETSVISTFFMQNYWRNDSLILTSFVAVDWNAGAIITGPYLRYFWNEHLFFDVGVNLLWGSKKKHNIRNLCSDGSLGCLAEPTSWQDGNWQSINAALRRAPEAPFWGKESFADKFMESRDEFWFGVTYQF